MKWISTERIARACALHPWRAMLAWALLVAAGVVGTMQIAAVLSPAFTLATKPESARAEDYLEERLRGPEQGTELIIVRDDDRAASDALTVDDAAFQEKAEAIIEKLEALPETVEPGTIVNFYAAEDPQAARGLVSQDRKTLLIPMEIIGDIDEGAENVEPVLDVIEEENGGGFEVITAGQGSIEHTFNKTIEEDTAVGEQIGVPVALIILLLVFGAAVAAGLPIVMAIVSIIVAFGVVTIVGQAFDLSFLILQIIPMIGLAVGIDYSLLIVQRFREERAHGLEKVDAISMAGATATRTVVFSGATVIVGLLGMTIVPSTVYRSIALGTSVVTAVAVLSALTLLPAVLSLLGDKVNALRLPFIRGVQPARDGDEHSGFWGGLARIVMAHPWVSVIATVSLLVACALPALDLKLGLAGVSTLPEGTDSREAFETLDREFSAGRISPAEIVIVADDVRSEAVQGGLERLQTAMTNDSAFGAPLPIEYSDDGTLLLMSVPVEGDPSSDRAHAAIRRLRSDLIPQAFEGVEGAEVLVTGFTAGNEDFYDVIKTYAPYVFLFVLSLSFLFLMVVFRSIVVPAKALIMNLLSVGAAYGLIVLIFQKGVGNELLGFQEAETIEAWLPLFLFSVLFGLSMDYHVFLLSRIRERFDQTGDNARSVAFGLRSTAGMITGAAMIMVAVFTGFALGDIVSMQELGFGLAIAVILDATIIRSVLVPASMELLGDWNWYLPKWLQWLPRLQVEGPHRAPKAASGAYAAGGD